MQFLPLAVGALSATAQVQQGRAAEEEAKFAAEQEGIRARDEAIARREKLIEALAMQNAKVGASGITQVGSPVEVMTTDIERFEFEDISGRVSGRNEQNRLRAAGANAKKAGYLGAGISLLDSASKTKKTG